MSTYVHASCGVISSGSLSLTIAARMVPMLGGNPLASEAMKDFTASATTSAGSSLNISAHRATAASASFRVMSR